MSPEQTRNRETARAAPPPAGLLRLPQLLQQRDRLTLDPAREPRADGIETTPIRESRKLPLIMIRQAQNNRKQNPIGVPQTAVQLRCRRWDLRRWRARKSAMRSSFCMSTRLSRSIPRYENLAARLAARWLVSHRAERKIDDAFYESWTGCVRE